MSCAARRWPHHGLTAAGEDGPDAPFAVAEDPPSGLRLMSVNRAAMAEGLGPGMALTDARAMLPGLATAMRDRGAETRFRAGLLRWAQRFSPWAATEAVEDTPERGGEGGSRSTSPAAPIWSPPPGPPRDGWRSAAPPDARPLTLFTPEPIRPSRSA